MINEAKQYMAVLDQLNFTKLDRLGLIAYGKIYGAAYAFQYLKMSEMPFILNFIKIYYDDYIKKAYHSQLELQEESVEDIPAI